jgi:hypothetical protein
VGQPHFLIQIKFTERYSNRSPELATALRWRRSNQQPCSAARKPARFHCSLSPVRPMPAKLAHFEQRQFGFEIRGSLCEHDTLGGPLLIRKN